MSANDKSRMSIQGGTVPESGNGQGVWTPDATAPRPIDVPRARRIADRLKAAGDTPAAELIEGLLTEVERRNQPHHLYSGISGDLRDMFPDEEGRNP